VENTKYQRYIFCSFAQSIRRHILGTIHSAQRRQYKRHDNGGNISCCTSNDDVSNALHYVVFK